MARKKKEKITYGLTPNLTLQYKFFTDLYKEYRRCHEQVLRNARSIKRSTLLFGENEEIKLKCNEIDAILSDMEEQRKKLFSDAAKYRINLYDL